MYDQNYLAHHGVKGMKWGIRKGTVSLSTQRKIGDEYTDRQQKKMAKQTKRILTSNIKKSDRYAEVYNKKADKQLVKGNVHKSSAYRSIAQQYINNSKYMNTKLNAIDANTIKAGKDYVTNTIIESGFGVMKDTRFLFDQRIRTRVDFRD